MSDEKLEILYKDLNCIAELMRKMYSDGCTKYEIHCLNLETLSDNIKRVENDLHELSEDIKKVKEFQTKWIGVITFVCSLPPWLLLFYNFFKKGV